MPRLYQAEKPTVSLEGMLPSTPLDIAIANLVLDNALWRCADIERAFVEK